MILAADASAFDQELVSTVLRKDAGLDVDRPTAIGN
jgi:hypothetical protein